jgi:hypothetical protein
LGEYRQRILAYKYAKFGARDFDRKLNRRKELKAAEQNISLHQVDLDALTKEIEEEADKWEEDKDDKEVLDIFNNKRASVHYMQAAIQVAEVQVALNDKQHEVGVTNLTDASKIPREIASELFQSSAVAKVETAKIPGYEFKEKTAITASEMLAYLKSIVIENGFFTFSKESDRLGKLVSKVHRYLKTGLPSYAQKCLAEAQDYVDITQRDQVASNEIIAQATTVSSWTDFQGKKSYMFYVLGPMEASIFENKAPEVDGDAQAKMNSTGMQKAET